ncbi:MAG TPA: ABC transporter substrate-binding protein [Planctomycetota bacterium]|nr:ABC transporter substrate-binding protein [Planctomycetota bacterium]
MRSRTLVACLAAAAVACLLAWLAFRAPELDLDLPPLDEQRPRPQGGFWVSAVSEPEHLNPFTSADAVARSLVLRYTHDTLLDRDVATGAVVPAVAESMELEGDTLAVRLREGVVFSDGTPLTLDDLEFVWRVGRGPGVVLREALDAVDRFERTGPRSFRLHLAARRFKVRETVGLGFPVLQARWFRDRVAEIAGGGSVPAEGSAEFADLLARVALPGPGTGPYQLGRDRRTGEVAWRRAVDLWIVQNPTSWRRKAQPEAWNLMGMHLRFLTDPAACLAELRAGRLDWYAGEDAERLFAADPVLRERMRLLEYASSRSGHHVVYWNLRRPPLDDVRVRRALSMLFDREAIVESLMGGRGQPAAAWFRPGEPEYPDDLAPPPFDPRQARKLLEESGFVAADRTLRLSILFASEVSLHRRILELAQPAFAAAGIDLSLDCRQWSEVVARYEARDFDAVLMSWNHEPFIDPFGNFHSSAADPPGKNYSGLKDPEVDRLLSAARAELDDAARAALYRRFAHRLHELAPVALLVHPRHVLLVDRRFSGLEPGRLGVVPDRCWVAR